MAVVSISRIQVRRGRASDSGIPQLASGELGWAVDTQELYIGNGSTAEGAPAVGNTQILTENTNVINLVGQYTYRKQESNLQTSETTPVSRSIAERLDDRVSIRAFGGQTVAQQLQKALYELFLRGNTGAVTQVNAPVLHIEPGVYEITETVYVPPFTTIIGAGKGKTVFRKTGNFDMFRTISSESEYAGSLSGATVETSPADVENQARRIRFENLTLETTGSPDESYLLHLDNCRDSEFKEVQFICNSLGTDNKEKGVGFTSKSDSECSNNNKFLYCDFFGIRDAVYSQSTVKDNSFVYCKFDNLVRGIVLAEDLLLGQTDGALGNNISHSRFDNINEHAILVPIGTGNKSQDNWYSSKVGNNITSDPTPVISYGTPGNFSIDDIFERTKKLSVTEKNVKYYPEVEGNVTYTNGSSQQIIVGSGETPAFRLPADTSKFYVIEYFFSNELNTFKRQGTLSVIFNRETKSVELVDEYEHLGDDAAGGASIKFKSEVQYDPDDSSDIWAVKILTKSSGSGPDVDSDGTGDGVNGNLVIKITSKS